MLTVISVALAAPTHSAFDSAGWSVVATVDNADAGDIAISTAKISGVDCFRGSATTDVAADKMLAVVTDIEGAKRWSSAGITDAKLLGTTGGTYSYYQYLDVPGWTMASDRYWFLRSTITRSGDRVEFRWDPLPSDSPYAAVRAKFVADHPDAVEPPVNVGSWAFQGAGGKTTVTYTICTQPGGSLPTSIQNAATRRTLPDTIADVIKEARKR